MRLVDDHLCDGRSLRERQKAVCHQSFRRDIDNAVHALRGVVERQLDLPFGEHAVDVRRAHAALHERAHLILHEGDQRGDNQCDARQDQRRNLIADGLARARGHDRHDVAPGENGRNHALLPRSECVVAKHVPQHGSCLLYIRHSVLPDPVLPTL